jgi:uncharacterized protein (TIGR00255 family)
MTGFGRGEASDERYCVTCEIKSVNHRYFEFSAKVPRGFLFLEDKLKSMLAAHVSRGKVECYVQVETIGTGGAQVKCNEPLLTAYVDCFAALEQKYPLELELRLPELLRLPDVFQVQKQSANEDEVWVVASKAVASALDQFVAMRRTEGEHLAADLLANRALILDHVAFVEARSPVIVARYAEKIRARMTEILDGYPIDEQRLLAEAAMFADKTAVDEETVRLRAHMSQLANFLEETAPVGRKLDFLVQEINRESNTIGSKAQDIEIALRVVEMKSLVEKMREQVQNIE